MATATKRTATKKSAPAKPAPVDDELEELEKDEVEEAPAAKAAAVTFGVADVCKLINARRAKEGTDGKDVTPRELRTLIRKMAREDSPRVDREIKAGNRSRYDWSGPKDPEVQAIVKAYFGGELEADKQEKLAALKARKAEKVAAAPAKKASSKKAAAVVEEEDEDVEELELDDEE